MDDDNLLPFQPRQAPTPKRPPDGASPTVAGWYAGMLGLTVEKDPCPGFQRAEWSTMRERALVFLDAFGEDAAHLGWTTGQLFAVHERVGIVRLEACGALMVPGGSPVIGVTELTIAHERLTYRRDKAGKVWGVPVWEYQWPAPKEVKPQPGRTPGA